MNEHGEEITDLNLEELRIKWSQFWGKKPHGTMGRSMMIESIKFKKWEQKTGGLNVQQETRLDNLIKIYKCTPDYFDKNKNLKPGSRLVRTWKGKKYCVTIKLNGYEYEGNTYSSLSKIANTITGSRWNGWLFFGLNKANSL